MDSGKIERVIAWKCSFCGSLTLDYDIAESCHAQCLRVLDGAAFHVDDRVSLLREADAQVFTVVDVKIRRLNGGTPGIVYVCEDAQGRRESFPARIIVRAKNAQIVEN